MQQNKGRQIVLLVVVGLFLGTIIGCESLNRDPNNKYWFPSFEVPGHLNPDHEYWAGEGSDPYMDASIGPRGMQARPTGFDLPRSRTTQVSENRVATIKHQPASVTSQVPNFSSPLISASPSQVPTTTYPTP